MSQKKESGNAATADRELMITRLLNAPVELVWEVFSNPDHIKNWWGPNGFTNSIFKMDMQPGGDWEFIMHGPDGTDYKNHNIFRAVEKHKRIVYEHVSVPWHLTTISFEAQGDKTFITWHGLFESKYQLEQVVKVFKADEGLIQNIERLSTYLTRVPVIIERIFNVPIERVWNAITNNKEMKQWYFDLPAFKAAVGFEFEFLGGKEGEKQYRHLCKVTEVIPGKKIAYSWRYDGYEGISFVSFELTKMGDQTILKLTHAGLETFPASNPDLAKENFAQGWAMIIGTSLEKYLNS